MREIVNNESLRPNGKHFRWLPLGEAFLWEEVLDEDVLQVGEEIYGVGFFSILKPETDDKTRKLMGQADDDATNAAREIDGFGGYRSDKKLYRNLVAHNTCIWDSEESAKEGLRKDAHINAMKLTYNYAYYEVTGGHFRRNEEKPKVIEFEPVEVRAIGDIAVASLAVIKDIQANPEPRQDLALAA